MAQKPQQQKSDKLSSMNFAVVDFETTGFNPQNDRIVQMAAIVVNGEGHVVDSFDTVVKPEGEYTHGAEHVHGISADMVSRGMPVSDAIRKLWDLTDGAVFTAHNAKFDIGFLHAESERIGIKKRVEAHLDTLHLARRADEAKERKHSLEALCDYYGIKRDRAHEARSDAEATAQLMIKLFKELGVKSQEELDQHLRD